jgi:hypothetical protein
LWRALVAYFWIEADGRICFGGDKKSPSLGTKWKKYEEIPAMMWIGLNEITKTDSSHQVPPATMAFLQALMAALQRYSSGARGVHSSDSARCQRLTRLQASATET